MLRYAITDRASLPGDESERRLALFAQVRRWAMEQIDYIQLREKELVAGELESLSRAITGILAAAGSRTKLLVNSRPDVAIAAGAQGVHLTASPGGMTPAQVCVLYASAGLPEPVVSVSCHAVEEVVSAREQRASLILFAPVFGKSAGGAEIVPAAGLEMLRAACRAAGKIPVLALGGVTEANASDCIAAGAAGVAGIRLFT